MRTDAIVVGVDASAHSRAALEFAFTEADLTGRYITAVHAYATMLTAYPGTLMVPPVPDPAAGPRRASKLLHQELLPWQEK